MKHLKRTLSITTLFFALGCITYAQTHTVFADQLQEQMRSDALSVKGQLISDPLVYLPLPTIESFAELLRAQNIYTVSAPPPDGAPLNSNDVQPNTNIDIVNAIDTQETTDGAGSTQQLDGDTRGAEGAWYQQGGASWYGGKFQGRTTANGETFDTNLYTAAHRILPFNSIVEVYNPNNEKSVLVRINDRGPFVDDRIIDLSRAAANDIGLVAVGVSTVYIKVIRDGRETQKHIIQIGSFAQHNNAIDLMHELQTKGFEPVIESVNNALFRVVIQGVEHSMLDQLKIALRDNGYHEILIRTVSAPTPIGN